MSINAENPFKVDDEEKDLEVFLNDTPPEVRRETPANESLTDQYERLKAREANLRRRQEELQEQRTTASGGENKPNWPKYVSVYYINLQGDIPAAAQNAIKAGMLAVILVLAQSFLNFLSACTISLETYSKARGIVLSIVLGIVSNYFYSSVDFPRLYKSCKKHDIPFSWTLIQIGAIAWFLYLLVGFPTSGSVGFATFLDLVSQSDSVWSKFIAFVNTMLLLVIVVVQFFILQQSQKYQKVSGVADQMLQDLAVPNV